MRVAAAPTVKGVEVRAAAAPTVKGVMLAAVAAPMGAVPKAGTTERVERAAGRLRQTS